VDVDAKSVNPEKVSVTKTGDQKSNRERMHTPSRSRGIANALHVAGIVPAGMRTSRFAASEPGGFSRTT